MWFKPKHVGFNLTVQMLVDQETSQTVQLTCNAPIGSTAEDLGGLLATMRKAGWLERMATNERILARAKTIQAERAIRIAKAEEEGTDLDKDDIAAEDASIASAILKMETEVTVDSALAGNGAA